MQTLEIVRNADGLAMTDNAGEVKKEFTNIKLFETKKNGSCMPDSRRSSL